MRTCSFWVEERKTRDHRGTNSVKKIEFYSFKGVFLMLTNIIGKNDEV